MVQCGVVRGFYSSCTWLSCAKLNIREIREFLLGMGCNGGVTGCSEACWRCNGGVTEV